MVQHFVLRSPQDFELNRSSESRALDDVRTELWTLRYSCQANVFSRTRKLIVRGYRDFGVFDSKDLYIATTSLLVQRIVDIVFRIRALVPRGIQHRVVSLMAVGRK